MVSQRSRVLLLGSVFLLSVLASLPACQGEHRSLDEKGETEEEQSPLYRQYTTWPKVGSVYPVPYCTNFDAAIPSSDVTQQRGLIAIALRNGWQKWTRLSFSDRGACSSAGLQNVAHLEMNIFNGFAGWGTCSRGAPGTSNGISVLQATLGRDPAKTVEANDELGAGVIVHELGHCIGFAHEQLRPDGHDKHPKCALVEESLGTNSGLLTLYDDQSTMSYCGGVTNEFRLTWHDIIGSQDVYEASSAGRWLKASGALSGVAL
jgi:hypothetical protein